MNLEQLATLPLPNRIRAMEILWTSMDSTAQNTSPAWHTEILQERRIEIESGQYSNWDEAKSRLKAKYTLH